MFFYTFLPKILNMSLTASVAILFVLLLRLLLKKVPKVISYALWGVVLFRLLCPVSIESGLSLFGLLDTPTVGTSERTSTVEYIPTNIVHTEFPEVVLPMPGIGEAITEVLPKGEEQLVADPLEAPMSIATYVWVGGILIMAVYGFMTYVRLRRALVTASPLRDNIYLADGINSPFVMGLFRPKIYLPSEMEEREQTYILLHEQHHIRRLDHIVKALAFVALCIHWFNPLVWAAFILSSKDMEMSCDEAVVRKLGPEIRGDYSASLLSLTTGKHIIAGMPLAFGEGNTKDRIKNLANWKKPAFWVVLVAVIACAALAVCLLTNPKVYPEEIQVNNHLYLRQESNTEALPEGSYELGFLDRILHRTEEHPPGDFSAVNLDAKYAGNMLYQSGEEADVIYLEDLRGFYIPFKTELEDGDAAPAPVLSGTETASVTVLTEEEIAQVNEVFAPLIYDKQGNVIGGNPWSCFFTSYYDDVRQLDFEAFLRYFPGDGSEAGDAEFEALKSVDVWPFKQVETRKKMPVPIHKYPSRLINLVLDEYAGITLDDLDTSKVAYLPEYDAYYNYTSDFGPGMFVCTRGEVEGGVVRLYAEYSKSTVLLTLRKEGDQYRIVSHQKIEG